MSLCANQRWISVGAKVDELAIPVCISLYFSYRFRELKQLLQIAAGLDGKVASRRYFFSFSFTSQMKVKYPVDDIFKWT